MKRKLTRLLSLLCLVATVATCLVIVPMTVSAATPTFRYDQIELGSTNKPTVGNASTSGILAFYGGSLYSVATGEYAPLASGTYSLADLFGKSGAYADVENQITFYDTYFKQFETDEFANGLDNRGAVGYAAAVESAIAKLQELYPSAVTAVGTSTDTKIEFKYCNANPNYSKFKTYDFVKEGNGFWVEFDYYYTPDYTSYGGNGNFQFRINKSGAIRFDNKHTMTPYTTFTGSAVSFTEEGWNRVSLFFHQTTEVDSTTVDDVTTYFKAGETMTVTVYVNGVEKTVWDASANGMQQHPLYTSTVDANTGAITATPKSWGSYAMSLYCTSLRPTQQVQRVSRFGAARVWTGTKADLSVKPLSYELDAELVLPTEKVEPATEQFRNADNHFFIPLDNGSGVTALTFLDKSVKNYYDTEEALALPTPISQELGREFLGWFDSEDNAVTSVATMPSDGQIYAKLSAEGDYTLTIKKNGTVVDESKPTGNAYLLGNEAEKWIVGDEIKSAGETITLTADTTIYALTVELLDGASARAAEHSGLRFETVLDAELYAVLSENFEEYTVGTLIIPTDLLGSTEFTAEALDTEGEAYIALESGKSLRTNASGDFSFFAAIVDIKAQNYARKFSAISYIEVDGVRVYTEYSAKDNSRSVYEVACASDKAAPDAPYASVIRGYINGVVEIADGAQVAPYAGYVHPLTATVEGGVLTISAAEALTASDLKTVILDGVNYTGGWTVSDGKLVANLPQN